mmetsp:Transcript_26037/g.72654  ORF Transcript_26037/g.72654 Transcript_26037/m.72654 type:complete len:282 (-) Transcript_26037:2024-2869(-)
MQEMLASARMLLSDPSPVTFARIAGLSQKWQRRVVAGTALAWRYDRTAAAIGFRSAAAPPAASVAAASLPRDTVAAKTEASCSIAFAVLQLAAAIAVVVAAVAATAVVDCFAAPVPRMKAAAAALGELLAVANLRVLKGREQQSRPSLCRWCWHRRRRRHLLPMPRWTAVAEHDCRVLTQIVDLVAVAAAARVSALDLRHGMLMLKPLRVMPPTAMPRTALASCFLSPQVIGSEKMLHFGRRHFPPFWRRHRHRHRHHLSRLLSFSCPSEPTNAFPPHRPS